MNDTEIQDRSIWYSRDGEVKIIDQRYLPIDRVIATLHHSDDAVTAIAEMWVRGAPLIGATAAYGVYLAIEESDPHNWKSHLASASNKLRDSRPTAVNLSWALERMNGVLAGIEDHKVALSLALNEAQSICEQDIDICHRLGTHGLPLIEALASKGRVVNILTHCNAGRMATVKWGTATAPIYLAHEKGIPLHVWVDETRPRNQGARITAWELAEAGIPHSVIADNTGGHLMQAGMVDLCLVGTDRTARNGDVANKIGTYLKALAAHDNGIPFYVALPLSSLDMGCASGSEIPIEERSAREVTHIWGESSLDGLRHEVRLTPEESQATNFGFDVTPARLITGLITEKGICEASEERLKEMLGQ